MSYGVPVDLASERDANSGVHCPPNRNYLNARHHQVSFMENQVSDSASDRTNVAELNTNESRVWPQKNGSDAVQPASGGTDALLAQALTLPSPHPQQDALDPHAIWQQLLGEFALENQPGQLDAWIQASQVLHYEDGHFIIALPNAYYLDWAQSRLRPRIKRKLSVIMKRSSVDVTFRVVAPSPDRSDNSVQPAPLYTAPVEKITPVSSGMAQAGKVGTAVPQVIGPVNSKYTFDSLVVGKHNRMAVAAADVIAHTPGERFNPLFVYGGSGLGKTHLLNAIANRLAEHRYRVLYCSAEQFTNDLVHAIRDRSTDAFRAKYRALDVLLIDDVQFIVGKESTQEELFHTFNDLHAAGKQLVLTSDCPPRELPSLEDRLRNRFEGGLLTDIVMPDFETRVAILQTKLERQSLNISYDVLMVIADRIKSNVRELEGALNNVWLYAQTHGMLLTAALTDSILGSLGPRRTPCTPPRTIARVAEYYGLTVDDLTGRRRTADIARARQVAMYLLREENGLSLPSVGEFLGGRDHSTVSHGVEKIAGEIQSDEGLRQAIVKLRDRLYLP